LTRRGNNDSFSLGEKDRMRAAFFSFSPTISGFMGSPLFHLDLLTAHEPGRFMGRSAVPLKVGMTPALT
jgi:hypothetical protein